MKARYGDSALDTLRSVFQPPPTSAGIRTLWPRLETGNNSVVPWISPTMIASAKVRCVMTASRLAGPRVRPRQQGYSCQTNRAANSRHGGRDLTSVGPEDRRDRASPRCPARPRAQPSGETAAMPWRPRRLRHALTGACCLYQTLGVRLVRFLLAWVVGSGGTPLTTRESRR